MFFSDDDREYYLSLFSHYTKKFNVFVLSYCLMTNHVHHLLVPPNEEALKNALRPVHKLYAEKINERFGWKGHLWQERFFSSPVDADHFWPAVGYIERNPVESGLVAHPSEYRWSSARARCGLVVDDNLYSSERWKKELGMPRDWHAWLNEPVNTEIIEELRKNTRSDLPTGSQEFLRKIEKQTGLPTKRRSAGRPPKTTKD